MPMQMPIMIDQFPIRERLALDDGHEIILFNSYPSSAVKHEQIWTREVCLFSRNREFVWQISPENGVFNTTKGYFDRESNSGFDFLHIYIEKNKCLAMRFNGDTFAIDMETGEAKFEYWQRN